MQIDVTRHASGGRRQLSRGWGVVDDVRGVLVTRVARCIVRLDYTCRDKSKQTRILFPKFVCCIQLDRFSAATSSGAPRC